MSKQVKARTVACIVMDYLRKTKMVKVVVCVSSAIGGLMTIALDLPVMMINMRVHFADNILCTDHELSRKILDLYINILSVKCAGILIIISVKSSAFIMNPPMTEHTNAPTLTIFVFRK